MKCWVCGSADTRPWKARNINRPLVPEDLQITDRRYGVTLSLRKCGTCDFIFANDEELSELVPLYEQLSDPGYVETQETRALQMRWVLRAAQTVHPTAVSVLDIGAGTGLLVAEAKQLGLQAVGIEPSRALVESARQLHAVDILQGVFPHATLTNQQFDIIFLIDVIEHVSQPVTLLRDCAEALSPRGIVVVVTPDVSSLPATILGQRWWHFRLAHVGYFNRRSLEQASQGAGLSIVRQCRAKWFFPLRYLMERLAMYLPIGWVNQLALRVSVLHWLYNRVVPLNLHDSFVVFLQRTAEEAHREST
jgi:2-polyprenyl-3-methyl-5-hydroxy-6-metoxy-1,4-benzoquinol methylase